MDWDPVKFSGDLTRPPSVHSLKPDVDIFAAFMMPKYAYTASWPGLRFPTTRVSFGSLSLSQRKRIKYASGKNSDIELMPQPSDDPDDPLVSPHAAPPQTRSSRLTRTYTELATMEKRPESGLTCRHGWSHRPHEGSFPSIKWGLDWAFQCLIYMGGCPDSAAADAICSHWCRELNRIKILGQTSHISGFSRAHLRRIRLEYGCWEQFWFLHGSPCSSGAGLGCV